MSSLRFWNLLFLSLLFTGALYSQITVTSTNDSGNGSLRQAIADASPGDTIIFDAALNGETITLAGSQLTIVDSLTIDASGLSNGLILDANDQSRVMEIEANTVVSLHSLTLIGGQANESFTSTADGGGIFAGNGVTLTLQNCTLSDNVAGNGTDGFGGDDGGFGGRGGAIFADNGSILTLNSCTLSNNRTGNGGDGDGDNGGFEFFEGTFGGKGGDGGAIFVDRFSDLTLNACTLYNNMTGNGGDGTPGETRGGDGDGGSGGAISVSSSTITLALDSCTISSNTSSATGRGGGIFGSGSTSLTIENSIVAGNSGNGTDDQIFGTDASGSWL